jgi:hypothetical protein
MKGKHFRKMYTYLQNFRSTKEQNGLSNVVVKAVGTRTVSGPLEISEIKHTRTKTFRLSEEAAWIIEHESKDRGLSENLIANELITNQLRRLRVERQLGLNTISLSDSIVRAILDNVSDDVIIEIADQSSECTLLADAPLELYGSRSCESVISMMKLCHEVAETSNSGKRVLVMTHFGGKKYSLLVGKMYEGMFARTGTKVKLLLDENHVVFTVESQL